MHFPQQLRILATLNELRHQASLISFQNATWKRRWSLRTCLSSASASGLDAPPLGGKYYVTVYASHAMARRDVREAHNGLYSLSLLQTAFERSPLLSSVQRQGCLRRGGAEVLSISSTAAEPDHTSLGLAQVSSFLVSDASNHASELAVRRAAPPTATLHDVRVAWPDLRASQSACDVQAAQTWHLRVALAADAEADEVFFEIDASLENSVLQLGESARGFACCGTYRYYAFPALSEREAAMVRFNLTTGAMKTIYWKYGSCPVEEQDVDPEQAVCSGWCVLQWLRLYSGNLGRAENAYSGVLRVPLGSGEEPDKRRGGMWYLGLQALEGAAEYTIDTASYEPTVHTKTGCSRLDRYCPSTNAWGSQPPSYPEGYEHLTLSSAAERSGRRAGHRVTSWVAPALSTVVVLCAVRRGLWHRTGG